MIYLQTGIVILYTTIKGRGNKNTKQMVIFLVAANLTSSPESYPVEFPIEHYYAKLPLCILSYFEIIHYSDDELCEQILLSSSPWSTTEIFINNLHN